MLPVILQAPQSILELQESFATFSCSATGIPPPTISWTFTNADGQTNTLASTRSNQSSGIVVDELDLVNVTEIDLGMYSCVAANIFTSVNSSTATLVFQSSKSSCMNTL